MNMFEWPPEARRMIKQDAHPHVQMLKDTFDDIGIVGIVDDCNDAHVSTAVGTFERIDLVDFLN